MTQTLISLFSLSSIEEKKNEFRLKNDAVVYFPKVTHSNPWLNVVSIKMHCASVVFSYSSKVYYGWYCWFVNAPFEIIDPCRHNTGWFSVYNFTMDRWLLLNLTGLYRDLKIWKCVSNIDYFPMAKNKLIGHFIMSL